MFEFKFPDVGEGIQEGEIVKWRVKEGDTVNSDQIIAEVETDKAVVEIPCPRAGVVAKLHHKQGDTIKVGEILVTIAESGEKISAAPSAPSKTPAPATGGSDHYSSSVVGQLEEAPEDVITTTQVRREISKSIGPHIEATPAVRRLARDLHVDISKIKGSGTNGRVTEVDVRSVGSGKGISEISPAAHVSKKNDMYGSIDRVPIKGIRKATAEHMKKSLYTAPHVAHMDEADVTDLFAIRQKEKASAEKKGVKLTFLPFVVRAVVAALKEHPTLNASLDDEHEELMIKKYYNMGIAVDTPEGLLVPVVKDADKKSLLEISRHISDLADRAASRKLDISEMKGQSFTITNIGVIGGLFATPIINWPDVAILALGRIYDKVVFKDGKIVVRKVMPFSIAFDHRVLDGAEVARFSNTMKDHLENAEKLLIED